jgi:hypothetical protein
LYKGISFGIYFSGISHECHDLSLKLELGEEIKKNGVEERERERERGLEVQRRQKDVGLCDECRGEKKKGLKVVRTK